MKEIESFKELIQNFHDEIIRKVDSIESDNAQASLNFYEASIDQSVTSHFKIAHRLRRRLVLSKEFSASKKKCNNNDNKKKNSVKILVEEVGDRDNKKRKTLVSSSDVSNISCTSYEQLNEGHHNNNSGGKISVNSLQLESL